MSRRGVALVLGLGLAMGSGPAWASDPGMQAEIEVLKERLAKLEAQQAGAEGGNAVLQLPAGLYGVQMSGFVDTTYTYNLNEPETNTNTLRVFDTRSNGFLINNAQLTVEKPVSSESPVGFRTELMFGTDAEVVGNVTTGLGTNASTGSDEIEVQEGYVEYLAPLGEGLDVKFGKFATLHGAEVIEAKDNWNISRSFLFGFAIPFTHTGFRATYPWSDKLSTTVEVSNGWDLVDDTNKGKTFGFGVSATPLEGVSFSSMYMVGAEQAGDNTNQRHLLDLVLGWQPTEALQLKLNYDYGNEDDGVAYGDNAVWQGLAAYARYQVTDKCALAIRGEFMNDADGVRTAFTSGINGVTDDDVKLYGLTLTGEHKISSHLLARLEYRHDTANAELFRSDDAGRRSYQDTVGLQFITLF
jgi:hypothetical protein